MHQLEPLALAELRELARGGGWNYPLTDGDIRLVITTLPGRAVIGVARSGSTLWVLVDITKPHAHQHLTHLIEQWPLGDAGRPESPTVSMVDAMALLEPFVAGDIAAGV